MSPISIHIFFAQFPVVLTIFGLLMFIIGLYRKVEQMLEVAFYSLVGSAITVIFAFFSGRYMASVEAIHQPNVTHSALAYFATALVMISAILVLWLRYLPERRERALVLISLLILSIMFLLTEFTALSAMM